MESKFQVVEGPKSRSMGSKVNNSRIQGQCHWGPKSRSMGSNVRVSGIRARLLGSKLKVSVSKVKVNRFKVNVRGPRSRSVWSKVIYTIVFNSRRTNME